MSVPQKQPITFFRVLECQELGSYMRPLQVVSKSGPSRHVHNNIKHIATQHNMSAALSHGRYGLRIPATFGEKMLNSFIELYWGESLPVGRCVRHRTKLRAKAQARAKQAEAAARTKPQG